MAKGRRRSLDDAVLERRVDEELRHAVAENAALLERPPPAAEVVGALPHFLERTERLGEAARQMAMRLYHDLALCRYVALRGLELPLDVFAFEALTAEQLRARVVLDLEPGERPARLVMDGRGLVVTCLAPGMVPTGGALVSHGELLAFIEAHDRWVALQRAARDVSAGERLGAAVGEVFGSGWLVPRESVQLLMLAGHAAVPTGLETLNVATESAILRYADACGSAPPRTDGRVRAWLDATGAAAAWLAVLACSFARPRAEVLHVLLTPFDPAMAVGSATSVWPSEWWPDLYRMRPEWDGAASRPNRELVRFAFAVDLAVYVRRTRSIAAELAAAEGRPPEPDPPFLTTCSETLARLGERFARAGAELEPGSHLAAALGLFADVVHLALGERPPWGEDLVDDPSELDPMNAVDLCPPGGGTSLRPYRHLAQRVLATADGAPVDLFWTKAELAAWRKRRPLPRSRPGRFLPPFTQKPTPSRADKVPRNAPCPCGSGAKHKRCCGAAKPDEPG